MYSTCLFCHSDLGANEVIERFPVGRRLAFDPAKGRLWVVCSHCMRWNLTPLDERWEAIEDCERRFRDTKLRVSTDNIGMARLREGLELVRIGTALRPEIVVWRYGAVNQARRRRAMAIGAAGFMAGAGVMYFLGPMMGLGAGWITWSASNTINGALRNLLKGKYQRIYLPTDAGTIRLKHEHAAKTKLVAEPDRGWVLRVPHAGGTADVSGPAALQRLATLLTAVNLDGVRKQAVEAGERILTQAGSADALLRRLARLDVELPPAPCPPDESPYYYNQTAEARRVSAAFTLGGLAEGNRAALEMAANEETERRAMEGELGMLEAAWKEAEEIAAIADDLFLPESVRSFLDRARSR